MLKRIDSIWVQSESMNFRKLGKLTEGAKTDLFEIRNRKSGILLGYVRYWSAWRKYIFIPKESTLYDNKCLTDIADFLIMENTAHKELLESKKPKRIFSVIDHDKFWREKDEANSKEDVSGM